MVLLESGENYLETILILQQRNGNVRSIDIATEMNFSKPSVSRQRIPCHEYPEKKRLYHYGARRTDRAYRKRPEKSSFGPGPA